MAKLVGIDIRATHVRAVSLRTTYRRTVIEAMNEVDRAETATLEQAVQACALPLVQHADAVAVAVPGDVSFVHRLTLPSTALRQLDEVMPFELEAQIPVDIDDLVFDYTVLPRLGPGDPVRVLAAATRSDRVKERIALLSEQIGHEPDRVGCGGLPLANLASICPDLTVVGPVAIADLGAEQTEVVVMAGGQLVFARTLSVGVAGLPDTAPKLVAALRQTFVAAATELGAPVQTLYLAGGGAAAAGAEAYLSSEIGVATLPIPAVRLDDLPPEQADRLPRFARALGLALGLKGRPRDVDLRRGGLAYQPRYTFLKEKIPLLSGLAAAVLVSFFFSTWAEMRSLAQENEGLEVTLAALSKRALGEELYDPDQVFELLDRGVNRSEPDPRPEMDAFDVLVALSEAVPTEVVHDVDEFDMQRGQVKIVGVVGSTAEAQKIAEGMKHRCFKDVKIARVTQVVNSDRQKYTLEFEVRCPSEGKKKTAGDKKGSE